MKKLKFLIHTCFLSGLITLLLSVPLAHAVTSKSERGLSLAPLRTELTIAPGTSLEGTLKVRNQTASSVKVLVSASTFKVVNEQYDYEFVDNEEPARWIRFKEESVTLRPNEERRVEYQVAVPLKAEPGGRYISLFVSADTKSRLTVPSKQRVASLLYITVKGAVTRTGQFLGLESPWLTSKDIAWSARIQNSGTTHFRSRYQITTKSLTGDVLSKQNEDALILPGTVRLVSDNIKISWPGIYKQEYLIGLGDSPAHSEQRWVIYSPPYATAIAAGTVGIIALLISHWLHRRHKRRKLVGLRDSSIKN